VDAEQVQRADLVEDVLGVHQALRDRRRIVPEPVEVLHGAVVDARAPPVDRTVPTEVLQVRRRRFTTPDQTGSAA
jgi:hypothetical protein